MPDVAAQAAQTGIEYPDMPSLALAYDLTRERVREQMDVVTALDTKVSFIIGSAAVLVGTALTLQEQAPATGWRGLLKALPLILALCLFIGIAIAAFFAYRVRAYPMAPTPTTLRDEYLLRREQDAKAEIFVVLVGVYDSNQQMIDSKAKWANIILGMLVGVAALLAIEVAVKAFIA